MADLVRATQEQTRPELLPQEESGIHADEQAFEHAQESQETFLEEEEAVTTIDGVTGIAPLQNPAAAAIVQKSEEVIEVEKIMEEGLGPLYATLPEAAKPQFKQKGEEAATEIAGMVQTLTLKLKRVLKLLRDWLLTIPNVNRFFLEQEAKIKTDKIIELVDARKDERQKTP